MGFLYTSTYPYFPEEQKSCQTNHQLLTGKPSALCFKARVAGFRGFVTLPLTKIGRSLAFLGIRLKLHPTGSDTDPKTSTGGMVSGGFRTSGGCFEFGS